jgi:hypothetical protein
MNAFLKKFFVTSDGNFLYYMLNGERKFVARFKHRGPITKAKFVKQLIANHTPAEYFDKLNSRQAPLAILRDADPVWYNQIMNPSN